MLDNGTLQHEALIQTVDIKKTTFEGSRGTKLNFRDAWQFNVAGYELAKMLELNLVPPYVERRVAARMRNPGLEGRKRCTITSAFVEL